MDPQADQAVQAEEVQPPKSPEPQPEIGEPPVRSAEEGYYKRKAEKAMKESEELKKQLESGAEHVGLDEIIEQKIEEKYSSKLDVIDRQQRRGEAAEYLEEVSAPIRNLYAKHKEKVWKYWDHESRKNLPFTSVLYEVIGPELAKEGARLSQEASEEATPVTGSSVRQTGEKVSFSKMSSKEFHEWEKKHGITGRDYLAKGKDL